MRIKRGLIALTALLAVFGVYLATSHSKESANEAPSALAAYPNGKDVRYRQQDGVWQIYYDASVDYPAEEVLRFINDSLKRQNWTPLKEDVLNPGLPSSHVTGWREYIDGKTSPKMRVRQWLAQWGNPKGDVVWYRLHYRQEEGTSSTPKIVNVFGAYYPADIVEQQRKAIEADKKQSTQQNKSMK